MDRAPARDEVHTWCVNLHASSDIAAALYANLSPDEQDRTGRLRFERDQQRFIVVHGALRHLLGHYLGTHPAQVRFVRNGFGKPALSPELGSRLRFNLSHSADLGLIALATDADVGVDIEQVRSDFDYADLAREFLPAAGVDTARAFFSSWTRMEASAKAHGEGLAASFHDRPWSLYDLEPAPGYVGALAIERRSWRLRQWDWRC